MVSQHDATNGTLQLLYDGHGSTRMLLDGLGDLKLLDPDGTPGSGDEIAQVFAYDAYGNMLDLGGLSFTLTGLGTFALAGSVEQALTQLLYSGEFTSAVTGLQYLRARFYDPSSGRFNRLDPFSGSMSDPLSLHKYLYTHGNPVMGVDPTGMFALAATLGAVAGGVGFWVASGANAGAVFQSGQQFQGLLAKSGILTSSPLLSRNASVAVPGDWFFTEPVGFLEGLIPIWGSLRLAAHSAYNGQVGWTILYLGLAAIDVIGIGGTVKAVAGLGRGAMAVGNMALSAGTGAVVRQFGGVVVRKVGSAYVKTIDEQAGWFWRWWGKESLEAQVRALAQLGDLAPNWSYRDGVLVINDAGKWAGSFLDLVGIYASVGWRLKTFFPDIRPWNPNTGVAGLVFDPVLNPLQEAAYYTLLGLLPSGGVRALSTY